MSKTNELIQTIQSHKIYTSTTLPDSPARANILLVHGLGEHCARYAHVSAFFSENEIATYTFDLPGHGKSDGKRGVMRYQKAWKIIDQLKTSIAAGNPGTPLFLYGHSLGGALALTYAARFPDALSGVIATSPGLGLAKPVPNFLVSLLGLAAQLLPDLTIPNGLGVEGLSHDENVVKIYLEDPLVHDRVSIGLAYDLISQGSQLTASATPFPLPLLLLQGLQDTLVNPETVTRFAENKQAETLTYRTFSEGFHELHNEPYKAEILKLILGWIQNIIE